MVKINSKTLYFVCCFLFVVSYLSCGVSMKHWHKVERMMIRRDYAKANEYIEKNKEKEYGERNKVLYYFDKAIILHHLGEYKESNKYLEKAENLIDELYTKSISQQAASLTVNDNVLPYQGEDFEQALINVIASLNYIFMNQIEDALVEGRKVDHKLTMLADRYNAENKNLKKDDKPTVVAYTEDAFVRYLMGLIFEEENEINDSFIFYRNAFNTYKSYKQYYQTRTPPIILQDLLKTADYLGFYDELNKYKTIEPDIKWPSVKELKEQGEIIFIHYNGLAPFKRDFITEVWLPNNVVRVALPEFEPRDPYISYAEINVNNGEQIVKTYLCEDITEIAMRNLKDRYPRLLRRAIARLVIKEGVKFGTRQMAKSKNKDMAMAGTLLNLGTTIAGYVTETADKRSWRLLPANIGLAKLSLQPGTYNLVIKFKSNNGQTIESKEFNNIIVNKGKKTFLGYRTYE